MRTETITFQEVALRGQKSVKCAGGCGRTLKRQQKFWQTLSPFNKTAAGFVKTSADIRAELETERSKWMLQAEFCKHCAGRGMNNDYRASNETRNSFSRQANTPVKRLRPLRQGGRS